MTQQNPDPWGNYNNANPKSGTLPPYQQPAQPQQFMPGPVPTNYQPPQPQQPVVIYQPVYTQAIPPIRQPKKWYQNGWIITGLVILALVVIGSTANAGKTGTSANPTVAAQNSQTNTNTGNKVAASEPTKSAALPGLNQAVTVGDVQIKVLSAVNAGNSIEYTSFGNKLTAVGTWIKVEVAIGNISDKTKSLGTWDFKLHDAQGRTYDASSDSFSYAIFQNLKSPSDPIPPGSAIQTTLLFDVTSNATGLQLEAAPDFKKQLFQLS